MDAVIPKLIHIKTLIEKLKGLDNKLKYQIEKAVKTAALGTVEENDKLKYRPKVEDLGQEASDDDKRASEVEDDKQIYRPAKLNPVFIDSKKSRHLEAKDRAMR